MKNVKVGFLDIPHNYFELDQVNKETICLVLMDNILQLIDKKFPKHLNRLDIMMDLLDASIETNVQEETYEVAQVLKDIKDLINEQTG